MPKIRHDASKLTLFVLVEQLLLPMFRLGSVSFKISYFILFFWLIHWFWNTKGLIYGLSNIKKIWGPFIVIICCTIIGEIYLSIFFEVHSYYETFRNLLTFVFAALAFSMAQFSPKFKMIWLLNILLASMTLNLAFIIFRENLPSWFINFYYPERAVHDLGLKSAIDVMKMKRPRGLFGNPNSSMLMINVIVLFIYLSIKNKVLLIKSATAATILIVVPIFIAILFSSRGETIVAFFLAILNYRALKGIHLNSLKRNLRVSLFFVLSAGFYMLAFYSEDIFTIIDIKRISSIFKIFESNEIQASTIYRPFIALNVFIERFTYSPIFGSGISAADVYPFNEGTQYFHNDIFYICAISGLIGVFMLFLIQFRLVSKLGWVVLIPFIFPGLVNTFMLNMGAFIAYFSMAGLLIGKITNSKINFARKMRSSEKK